MLGDKEVMGAILESYWPATNTFVTPNDELDFSLKEMKETTGLPILGELFEQYVPLDSELAAESKEFRFLFFPSDGLLRIYQGGPRQVEMPPLVLQKWCQRRAQS